MSFISSALRNLSSFLQDHQLSFSNGLLVLFTIGGEQIFKDKLFNCPCTHEEAQFYSLVFIIAPVIILGILGMMVSNLTWRLFHGICKRSNDAKHQKKKFACSFVEVASRALVVPAAWLFITFFDGKYYACMRSRNPCDMQKAEYENLVRTSQLIGWFALMGSVAFVAIVMCAVRCCDSATYLQNRYIRAYIDAENCQFDQITKVQTEALAKKNVETFVTNPMVTKKDWDEISVEPNHALSDSTDESLITRLHKWSKNHYQPLPNQDLAEVQNSSV